MPEPGNLDYILNFLSLSFVSFGPQSAADFAAALPADAAPYADALRSGATNAWGSYDAFVGVDQTTAEWDPRSAVGVVLAAGGYPGDYAKGDVITLPQQVAEGTKVFHAGTAEKDGQVVTSGGRVLCATALGDSVTEAQQRAYELVKQINWNGVYYRDDIAYRAIAREQQ